MVMVGAMKVWQMRLSAVGLCLWFCICIIMFNIVFGEDQFSECNKGGTYAKGSLLDKNLQLLLNELVNRSGSTTRGHEASVYGQTYNNTVYGMMECRGDTSPLECSACSLQAKVAVLSLCGDVVGGKVWLDHCFMRWENFDFIGKLDTNGLYFSNSSNVSFAGAFNKALQGLLTDLSKKAMSHSTGADDRYASGFVVDSAFHKIYGLLQCWEDIAIDDCQSCLSTAFDYLFLHYAGKSGGQAMLGSCIVRYETFAFFTSEEAAPPPSTRKSPPRSSSKSGKIRIKLPVLLGAIGACIFLVFSLIIGYLVCISLWNKRNPNHRDPPLHDVEDIAAKDNYHMYRFASEDQHIIFTLEAIVSATNNFHHDQKLGEGGFGVVYKGTLPDGKDIAVKKFSFKSFQGKREFLNEIRLLAKIQHRNLVNLFGCCMEGTQLMLVYEYLSNKSLDKILFDPRKRKSLNWPQRYNIILGVARGLLYLHEDSQITIIHRDIKASNILLDEELHPKIADFGLARLLNDDETKIQTRIAGTYGYMAPEYAMQGQLSTRSDVYSFGILLLEIVTAKRSWELDSSCETESFLGWIWKWYLRGKVWEIVDDTIQETCMEEELIRFIHVGLLCTQAEVTLRPHMSEVILMLSTNSIVLPIPSMPAFVNLSAESSVNNSLDSTK